MMAKIFVVGRVKRAAQIVGGQKEGSKSFLSCTVEVVRDAAGKQYTDYYSVNCYRFDEGLKAALAEGVMVCAEGVPGVNSYEGRDGKHRSNVKIIGSILPLTGKPKEAVADYDPDRPPV